MRRYPILITMGDPSGIGPEITLKSLASSALQRLGKDFLVIGDACILEKVRASMGLKVRLHTTHNIADIRKGAINIYDLRNVSLRRFAFGVVRKQFGRASIDYLEKALGLLRLHPHMALVTAPINKASLRRARVHYSGHTELLRAATRTSKVAMMLIGEPLRVTLVTRHLPLCSVHRHLTRRGIREAIELTHAFLRKYLRKRTPRIGVAALNPHGGEAGVFGREEERIIRPAVTTARKRYGGVYGPVVSEALFYDAYRGGVDGIVCMYHDQGLIPLKMIARDKGVNTTLGLPFIRTSPAHGTAFDIAGTGTANASSMIEAIKIAARLLRTNAAYKRA